MRIALEKCQSVCKPGSVWQVSLRGDHSSGTPVAGRLTQPTRTTGLETAGVASASFLFGFAPGGVYHAGPVAGSAVGSYPTFSPLPEAHLRRFDLCGTFPKVTLAGRYPAPSFHGARTFLPCKSARAAARPTDRPPLGHSRRSVNEIPGSGRDCPSTRRKNPGHKDRGSMNAIQSTQVSAWVQQNQSNTALVVFDLRLYLIVILSIEQRSMLFQTASESSSA